MAGNETSLGIDIPTSEIEDKISPILESIRVATRSVMRIGVYNPFSALKFLPKLWNDKLEIERAYEAALSDCNCRTAMPVSGPGMAMAFAQAWSTSKGLTAAAQLQRVWHDLDAVLDRKYAFSIAILSLYVSLISFVLSIYC